MIQVRESTVVALFDAAPDAMVVTDEFGRIVLVNASAERLFDYGREEVLGEPLGLLVQLPDSGYVTSVVGMQAPGRRRDGGEFSASLSISTLLSDTGLLTSLTIRDATDTNAVEAERIRVKSEAERTRLQAEAHRLHSEREKREAERVRLVVEDERMAAEGEKTEAERVRLVVEDERMAAEGEKTEAERMRLVLAGERRGLEEQLHQSQRMESLGQLAGGVAHDFNNLLAVILNYAAFIAEELASEAEASPGASWVEAIRDVEQIRLAAERASVLTHQLLSFARREVVQSRPLSLNGAISRMEQILRRTLGEQIELITDLALDLPTVVADPGQIEQIVLNLAINARDAMPTGGTLRISTALRDVAERGSPVAGVGVGSYVSICVRDTGIGMSEQVQDRAFEPFFTTKPKGEGSGLGLATVYGIVAQAGGYSLIASGPGMGTSMTVLLPASDQAAAVEERSNGPDQLEPRESNQTILIVDDENALREVTRRILTRNGYDVIVASSGAEAVQTAAGHDGPIDLILTDVIMPKMHGPTVASEVKKLRPGIRVLFMSGYARPVLEVEAVLKAGFLLLEKPFDQDALLKHVRKALDTDA